MHMNIITPIFVLPMQVSPRRRGRVHEANQYSIDIIHVLKQIYQLKLFEVLETVCLSGCVNLL